ncbi:hypothetical protein IG631_23262 [Alternaria alternata]|nr:hypothetical protein IG631_23262 [Alternaria alternata]
MARKARRADAMACATRTTAGKRSWGLEDGRVACECSGDE